MKIILKGLVIISLLSSCKKKTTSNQANFPPCEKSSENMSGRWKYGNDTLVSVYQSVDCNSKGNNSNYYKVKGIQKLLKIAFQDSTTFPGLDSCIMLSIESDYIVDYNFVGVNNSFRISKETGPWLFMIYYKNSQQYKQVNITKF